MAADKVYKRILLKLSGEALTGQEAFGIDPKVLDQLALEIGQLDGHQKRLRARVVPFPHFDPAKTRVKGEYD